MEHEYELKLLTGYYNYCMDNCDGHLREYAITEYLRSINKAPWDEEE